MNSAKPFKSKQSILKNKTAQRLGFAFLIASGLFMLEQMILSGGLIPQIPTASAFFNLEVEEYAKFLPGVQGDTFTEQTENILGRGANIVRLVIGSVAILFGLFGSIRMVTSQGNEEQYTLAKESFIYGVAGLALVALSGDLAQLLSPVKGGLLGSKEVVAERALLFNNTVRIIITFVKYFAGAIAVAMLVRIGFRMVTLGESDDELSQDKKNIGLIVLGLIVLMFSDTLIRRIFYQVDSPISGNVTPDLPQAMKELVAFINLMVTFIGPIGIITLVAGGLMYALSGANEELESKAKKMMTVSLIGIILVYGAFGIVNTFIIGRF